MGLFEGLYKQTFLRKEQVLNGYTAYVYSVRDGDAVTLGYVATLTCDATNERLNVVRFTDMRLIGDVYKSMVPVCTRHMKKRGFDVCM